MAIIRKQITARGTAHTNSTTESSLASYALAAGTLTPGKLYWFSGTAIATSTNSTDTLAVGVRFGSSATVASNGGGKGPAIDVANDDIMTVVGTLDVQSATRAVLSWVSYGPDNGSTAAGGGGSAVVTIDQSTAYRLDLTADWSVASASNSCAADSFVVIEIA